MEEELVIFEHDEDDSIEEDLDNGGLEGNEAAFMHGYLSSWSEED
jgi:hypothetical protein